MPLQPTYPGVYVQEIPSGTHTIAGVATSITAFVGYLRRGPLNTPVQCLNFGDFQRVFGGLDPQSHTSFQVSQFFLNGGSEAWVSRLYAASNPPVMPQASLPCGTLGKGGGPPTPPSPTQQPALAISALNAGTWGENVFVTVDYMAAGTGTFDLTATLYATTSTGYAVAQFQSLPGVTLDQTQPNYVVQALSGAANPYAGLITLADPAPPPGPTYLPPAYLPYASGTILAFAAPGGPGVEALVTVSVQLPTPTTPKATAPPPLTGQVTALIVAASDMIGAIQGALAIAGASGGQPTLANAAVRASTSPFAGGAASTLIQVVVGDPNLAGCVISVSAAPQAGLTQMTANVQAYQLQPPLPPKGSGSGPSSDPPANLPDGLPPKGIDVAGNATNRTGIYALEAMGLVNLLCLPDLRLMSTTAAPYSNADYLISATAVLNYALRRRAFAILDIPSSLTSPSSAVSWMNGTPGGFGPGTISAAAYYPEIQLPNPFGTNPVLTGASGTLAGIYAATDIARGVWKAPAGITAPLTGVQGLAYAMTDQENGLINPLGMNALRTFPVYDNISWGARTLAAANVAEDDWKYVPVRRLALYVEQSLLQGLQWAVFEPNDDRLWQQIRVSVSGFLQPLFLQGAFVGTSPAQAYQVVCDASTTTAQDMDNGVVNVLVRFAPVRPAEFVVISIQQMAGQSAA